MDYEIARRRRRPNKTESESPGAHQSLAGTGLGQQVSKEKMGPPLLGLK
jgi:hypothetical protein